MPHGTVKHFYQDPVSVEPGILLSCRLSCSHFQERKQAGWARLVYRAPPYASHSTRPFLPVWFTLLPKKCMNSIWKWIAQVSETSSSLSKSPPKKWNRAILTDLTGNFSLYQTNLLINLCLLRRGALEKDHDCKYENHFLISRPERF